jgi:hypothetical protein
MADEYKLGDFEPHVGTTFTVTEVEGGFPLELAKATATTPHEHQPRQDPFTLLFTGPPDMVLHQGTYTMAHDGLGEVVIFVVPVGPDPESAKMRYEAIFN